jgi:hypothetical protein
MRVSKITILLYVILMGVLLVALVSMGGCGDDDDSGGGPSGTDDTSDDDDTGVGDDDADDDADDTGDDDTLDDDTGDDDSDDDTDDDTGDDDADDTTADDTSDDTGADDDTVSHPCGDFDVVFKDSTTVPENWTISLVFDGDDLSGEFFINVADIPIVNMTGTRTGDDGHIEGAIPKPASLTTCDQTNIFVQVDFAAPTDFTGSFDVFCGSDDTGTPIVTDSAMTGVLDCGSY